MNSSLQKHTDAEVSCSTGNPGLSPLTHCVHRHEQSSKTGVLGILKQDDGGTRKQGKGLGPLKALGAPRC